MVANYVKVALRDILRHKGYSLINIIGLAVGLHGRQAGGQFFPLCPATARLP